MKPEIAAAWHRLKIALAAVNATLGEHQQIQSDARLIESKLTPRPPKPEPRREPYPPGAPAVNPRSRKSAGASQ